MSDNIVSVICNLVILIVQDFIVEINHDLFIHFTVDARWDNFYFKVIHVFQCADVHTVLLNMYWREKINPEVYVC